MANPAKATPSPAGLLFLANGQWRELERGEHLLKRKELYEWWHPETKAGAAQASAMNRALGNVADNLSVTSFAADTADKTGITDRHIRRSIKRAKDIDSKVRDRIRDNPEIADSGVENVSGKSPTEPAGTRNLVEATCRG